MRAIRAMLSLAGAISLAFAGIVCADDLGTMTLPGSAEQTTKFSAAPFRLAQSVAGATVGGLTATQLDSAFSGFKPEVGNPTRGGKDAQIYARLSPSVVFILTKDGVGSGVLISEDGTVLTNAHVVGKNDAVAVAFKPRQEGGAITKADLLMARTVKIDDVADLALIKLASIPDGVKPTDRRFNHANLIVVG